MYKLQNYISDELTHFVGRSKNNDDEKFNLLVNIIRTGILKTPDWDENLFASLEIDPNKSFNSNKLYNSKMVCFCDIPLNDMQIHMMKYSRFGISFKKDFLIKKGANPVYYIVNNAKLGDNDSSVYFDRMIKKYNDIFHYLMYNKENNTNEKKDIFEVKCFIDTRLISFIQSFDGNKSEDDPENYYMEREWRSLHKISFTINDIHRIILPGRFAESLKNEIPEYGGLILTLDE